MPDGDVVRERRVQGDVLHRGEALLALPVELVDARGDLGLADARRETRTPRRAPSGARSEWKPPGVIMSAVVRRRRHALHPGLVGGGPKCGIVGRSRGQSSALPQTTPVPRGPKSHLWRRRRRSPRRGRPSSRPRRRSRARRRRTAGCAARERAGVDARDHVGDRPHRRLHPGARVDPGDRDDARLGQDRRAIASRHRSRRWPPTAARRAGPCAATAPARRPASRSDSCVE